MGGAPNSEGEVLATITVYRNSLVSCVMHEEVDTPDGREWLNRRLEQAKWSPELGESDPNVRAAA